MLYSRRRRDNPSRRRKTCLPVVLISSLKLYHRSETKMSHFLIYIYHLEYPRNMRAEKTCT